MEKHIKYILRFLLGEENLNLADQIGYSKDSEAAVVIIPSSFFEKGVYLTRNSMPCLPLAEIEGVPLLFGYSKIVHRDNQVIVYADIIASTFFLITRYEECINQCDRDKYGRFPGAESLPYRAGFLMRPIVDEYGKLLRRWLREAGICAVEPPAMFRHVYLTHDVDEIWQWNSLYRALRTFVKRLITRENGVCESLEAWCNYERFDKIYTFPWLVNMDQSIEKFMGKKCTSIYFFKGGGSDSSVDNMYYKRIRRVRKLVYFLREKNAVFGMHASLSAGQAPQKIVAEKERLEKILGEKVIWNRNHYLCSRRPEDMKYLITAGIKDDFTMGYADVVGFRLGTCRPVRWINPVTKELTSLMLHPLTVMECTLDSEVYMNLKEEEAFHLICKMLKVTKKHSGEVVLLWHNTSVAESDVNYQRRMYEKTLGVLKNDKFMEMQ